jgi:hypothetical protein
MRPEARARARNDGRPSERAASCRPSDSGRQLPTMPAPDGAASGCEHTARVRSNWACVAAVLSTGVIALLGCQNTNDDIATSAGAEPRVDPQVEDAVTSDDYPLLQSVPPRPQLSYTVQQQREIAEALVADRENARYTSQVVRYRSGLSTLPPPPAPPTPAPDGPETSESTASAGVQPSAGPDVAEPQESLRRAKTFDVFLRALRRQFQSDAPEPTATEPDAPAMPIEPEQGAAAQVVPDQDVALAARSVNDPADQTASKAPHPPAETAVAARQPARSDQVIASPPLPPTDTALAARQATGADPPRPPTQTAVAARQAADPTDPEAATPIPAPRPDHAAHADPMPATMPEPPPGKPAWPVDGRSAALAAPRAVAYTAALTVLPTDVGARTLRPLAGKAVL